MGVANDTPESETDQKCCKTSLFETRLRTPFGKPLESLCKVLGRSWESGSLQDENRESWMKNGVIQVGNL